MASYVTKSIVETEMREYNTLGRALLLVQVAIWKARALGRVGRPLLLLERRPWSAAIGRYAKRQGVSIMTVTAVHLSRLSVRGLLGPWGVAFVRALRGRLWHWCFLRTRKSAHYTTRTRRGETKLCAKLAVPYQGQFNLNSPEMHSDLFFWHQSDLSSHDLLLLFEFEQDPLDQTKWNELSDCGIEGLALYPGATTVADVPFFTHLPGFRKAHVKGMDSTKGASLEAKWFRQTVCSYELDREYWTELFLQRGIKVYLTWRHFDARYKAIPEALEDLGGVSAAYQRSCQPDAGPHKKVDIDLMFGFGRIDGEVERSSGSVIPYHVTVGYFGDHRFPLLRNDAAALRLKLQRRGAEYIVAFFDENSNDDSRWHTGHEFMRENYVFVLEKLLADPSLGLVVKPKFPSNLRRRLGPVAALLKRALASGRCHIFDGGPLHGSDPPAAAALASDIAIHGHLVAATAGLEAALAGVPTLLLDREGWHVSSMFRLGEGRVVFKTWSDLWRALEVCRVKPGSIPGLGDWSLMLDELDPFRDGLAAKRIGTYLHWLLDGFTAGLSRNTVLADAAERYSAQWGADKIKEVNSKSTHGHFSASSSE